MAKRSKPRRATGRKRGRRSSLPDVTRVEFSGVLDQLRQQSHDLEIQFRRIADIQADLDAIRREWIKVRSAKARKKPPRSLISRCGAHSESSPYSVS